MSFKYTWLRAAQRIGFVADFLQLPGSTADFMPPKEIRPTIKKIISPDYNHDNPDSGIERLAHRLELVGLASLLMSARFYQTERDSLQDYLIDNFQPVQSEKEAEELTPINVNRRHDTSNSYCGKDSDEVSEINPKTLRDTLEYLAEHIQIMATHPYDSPAFSCAVKAATKLPGC